VGMGSIIDRRSHSLGEFCVVLFSSSFVPVPEGRMESPTLDEEDELVQLILTKLEMSENDWAEAETAVHGVSSTNLLHMRRTTDTERTFPVFSELRLEDAAKHVVVAGEKVTASTVRRVLNYAQLFACLATGIRVLSFDADNTIYEDGGSLDASKDKEFLDLIVLILKKGYYVAIVTAAGYPGRPDVYRVCHIFTYIHIYSHMNGDFNVSLVFFLAICHAQSRLEPLLDAILAHGFEDQFCVIGGECNYMLRSHRGSLEMLERVEWETEEMAKWESSGISNVLDRAERAFTRSLEDLEELEFNVLRKERAVGFLPSDKLSRKELDALVLRMRNEMRNVTPLIGSAGDSMHIAHSPRQTLVPFCLFNGGSDVWCDIGSKAIGMEVVARQFHVESMFEILHIGDQMGITGNDTPCRNVCPTLWVANPSETVEFITMLAHDLPDLLGS
jgi:IMP and pyridine-specific 5'-nucleotidase